MLRSAGQVKGELEDARRESERRGLQVGALARILQVGVVVAGPDLDVDYVSARALELCGCADEAAFRRGVAGARARDSPVARGDPREAGREPDLPRSRSRRGVRCRPSCTGWQGPVEDYLVLLSDPRALEAVEVDARLERQIDGLGRVYRTLAHELRAPLGAMLISLDLLQDEPRPRGPVPSATRRHVDVLHEELDRLSRSLSGILTQTVPGAPPEMFDLAVSLADLVALLAPQARRQAVDLEARLPDEPLPVRGYPDRLRQAFLNVAVNALEAMPRGGRLIVEARPDGARASVALRDNGPGIPRRPCPTSSTRTSAPRTAAAASGSTWRAPSWSCTGARSASRASPATARTCASSFPSRQERADGRRRASGRAVRPAPPGRDPRPDPRAPHV